MIALFLKDARLARATVISCIIGAMVVFVAVGLWPLMQDGRLQIMMMLREGIDGAARAIEAALALVGVWLTFVVTRGDEQRGGAVLLAALPVAKWRNMMTKLTVILAAGAILVVLPLSGPVAVQSRLAGELGIGVLLSVAALGLGVSFAWGGLVLLRRPDRSLLLALAACTVIGVTAGAITCLLTDPLYFETDAAAWTSAFPPGMAAGMVSACAALFLLGCLVRLGASARASATVAVVVAIACVASSAPLMSARTLTPKVPNGRVRFSAAELAAHSLSEWAVLVSHGVPGYGPAAFYRVWQAKIVPLLGGDHTDAAHRAGIGELGEALLPIFRDLNRPLREREVALGWLESFPELRDELCDWLPKEREPRFKVELARLIQDRWVRSTELDLVSGRVWADWLEQFAPGAETSQGREYRKVINMMRFPSDPAAWDPGAAPRPPAASSPPGEKR